MGKRAIEIENAFVEQSRVEMKFFDLMNQGKNPSDKDWFTISDLNRLTHGRNHIMTYEELDRFLEKMVEQGKVEKLREMILKNRPI